MIESIIKRIPPPARPEKVPSKEDWKCFEGTSPLPQSYKKLVATYGSGVFGDRLNLLSPLGDIQEVTSVLREGIGVNLADGQTISSAVNPGEFFPEKRNGLFVFANTFDGEYFLFARNGRSRGYSIYLRSMDWKNVVYEMFPDELIVKLLLGTLSKPCLNDFPPANIKFERDSEWLK